MGLLTNTLAHLSIGQTAVIKAFTDDDMSLKLLEMGCVPGEKVKLSKVAPMGDPIAISVAGYTLSLRREEASTVLVTI